MRLALMQVPPAGGVDEALDRLAGAAALAKGEGADILVTPEMYLTGYNIGAETVAALAESDDGPMAAAVAHIASEAGIAIVAGLPLRADGKPHNAAIFVDGTGKRLLTYRKTHLYGELDRAQFAAADALSAVVPFGPFHVALAICFDIEFPEVARTLARKGADLILVPTANMEPYDRISTGLVPARAEENGIFVAYANFCGPEGDVTYVGLSAVAGPDGRTLARADKGEALLFADLDPAAIAPVRKAIPYLDCLRPELYAS